MSGEKNITTTDFVILEDNCWYFYVMRPFELKNVLGNIVAVLKEFIFMKDPDDIEHPCLKLYKTKEGNWYDIDDIKTPSENHMLRYLKTAIDIKESSLPS